jgi:hypothetical protein
MDQQITRNELIWRIVAAASTVVLVLAVVAMFVFSDRDISIEQVGILIAATGGLFGLATYALRRNGGGGSGGAVAGGAALLIASAFLTSGCAPCLAETAAVTALDAGVSSVTEALPSGAEGAAESLDGIVTLGEIGLESCAIRGENRAAWISWAGIALEGAVVLVEILRSIGIPMPGALRDALLLLNDLLPVEEP